jgi:hypothetical protein
VRAFGQPWGIVEYNPRIEDEAVIFAGLQAARANGVALLCPYHWDNFGGENEVGYTIRDTAFERALRRFVDGGGAASSAPLRAPRQLSARLIRPSQSRWSS